MEEVLDPDNMEEIEIEGVEDYEDNGLSNNEELHESE